MRHVEIHQDEDIDNMKYYSRDIINEVEMSEETIILVEGPDDIQLYDKFLKLAKKKADIRAIENMGDYKPGCDGVLEIIKGLQNRITKENEKYILGIIDKDIRDYREPEKFQEEILGYKCLLILKYYSFESHFTNDFVLKSIISETTSVTESMITEDVINILNDNIRKYYEKLYFLSLEAVKNALEPAYKADVCFDDEPGNLFYNKAKALRIKEKESELYDYATKKNLEIESIKFFAKGKWILHFYSRAILDTLNDLSKLCAKNEICQCQFCATSSKNHNTKKCLWMPKKKYQVDDLELAALKYIDIQEVDYIINRFKQLA